VFDPKFVQRHKCWVILVDDEESIRMSVGDFLYDEGYQVTACDGAESLLQVLEAAAATATAAAAALPRVIVSDVRMPGTTGIQLLEHLRADTRFQRIPVVLLTAKAMTVDRIEGFKAGADAYLPKPFHPEELLSILDNCILRQQQMKEAQSSLAHLKEEMTSIQQIMKQNTRSVVQKTLVYLTPAERDVLELLCQGMTNKEISEHRGVSLDRTVKIIQKLFAQTKTKNRTELVRWAFSTGYASMRQ
jgi:DNA-binding NarL/FixJ family response regulator